MATLTNARQHRMRTRSRSARSEEHTSELQSQSNIVCRLLLEKKKNLAHHDTLVPPYAVELEAVCAPLGMVLSLALAPGNGGNYATPPLPLSLHDNSLHVSVCR